MTKGRLWGQQRVCLIPFIFCINKHCCVIILYHFVTQMVVFLHIVMLSNSNQNSSSVLAHFQLKFKLLSWYNIQGSIFKAHWTWFKVKYWTRFNLALWAKPIRAKALPIRAMLNVPHLPGLVFIILRPSPLDGVILKVSRISQASQVSSSVLTKTRRMVVFFCPYC